MSEEFVDVFVKYKKIKKELFGIPTNISNKQLLGEIVGEVFPDCNLRLPGNRNLTMRRPDYNLKRWRVQTGHNAKNFVKMVLVEEENGNADVDLQDLKEQLSEKDREIEKLTNELERNIDLTKSLREDLDQFSRERDSIEEDLKIENEKLLREIQELKDENEKPRKKRVERKRRKEVEGEKKKKRKHMQGGMDSKSMEEELQKINSLPISDEEKQTIIELRKMGFILTICRKAAKKSGGDLSSAVELVFLNESNPQFDDVVLEGSVKKKRKHMQGGMDSKGMEEEKEVSEEEVIYRKKLWEELIVAKKTKNSRSMEELLPKFRQAKDHKGEASALRNLGMIYARKNETLDKSKKFYIEALNSTHLANSHKDPEITTARHMICYTLSLICKKQKKDDERKKWCAKIPDMNAFLRSIKSKRSGGKPKPSGKCIYIGNLGYEVEEEELRAELEKYGEVITCFIPRRFSGKSKGFARAEFVRSGDAEQAINSLNRKEYKGRIIIVRLETEKK